MKEEKNEIIPVQIFDFPLPSEKIGILVNALRKIATDEDIKDRELLIPDDCEQHGFVEGYHNLGDLLYFLADMLEE